MDLAHERARRWWHDRAQVTTPKRATAFVEDVGFALLFPKANAALPSLWEIARDPGSDGHDWGPDIQRVWAWKDDLPLAGKVWTGKCLLGQHSLVSVEVLGLLHGTHDTELSRDARTVLDLITTNGPTATVELKPMAGMAGKANGARFTKAVVELGRQLLVCHYGTETHGGGWPSVVLDRTDRLFAVPKPARSPAQLAARRQIAAARFAATVIEAEPRLLARAFSWPLPAAKAALAST